VRDGDCLLKKKNESHASVIWGDDNATSYYEDSIKKLASLIATYAPHDGVYTECM
jgi:hypothetical protein